MASRSASAAHPKLLVTTPDGIWSSSDDGESFALHGFPRFAERDAISYCRGVAVKPDDPDTIFVGNGDFIPGKRGAIQRTRDGGKTWEKCALPVEPNSAMYWFGTIRRIPTSSSPTACMAMCMSRPMRAIRGPSCAASSARFAR